MPLKFCPKCGGKLEPDDDLKFCTYCGADLRDRAESKQDMSEHVVSQVPVPSQPRPQAAPVSSVQQPEQATPPSSPTQGYSREQFADFLPRFVAWLIDIILIGIMGLFISFFIDFNLIVFNLVDWLIGFLYFFLFGAFNNGQTLGKALFKFRTVDEDDLKVASTGRYLIDAIFKSYFLLLIIDTLIGLLANSGDPKKKIRLSQNIAKLVVIKE